MKRFTLRINFINIKQSEFMTICDKFGFKLMSYEVNEKEEFPIIIVEGNVVEISKFKNVYYKGDLTHEEFIKSFVIEGNYKFHIANEYLKKLNAISHNVNYEMIGEEHTLLINAFRIQMLNVNDQLKPLFDTLNYMNLIFIFVDVSNKITLQYCEVVDEAEFESVTFEKLIEEDIFTVIDLEV